MSEFTDFQNSELLPDEYDMRASRPESSLVSRDAAAAADDEFKLFVTAKAAAAAPDSSLMQKKLYDFAILFDRLNKNEITPLDFEAQIMDLDLTEDQKQIASMLCVEKLHGGKKNLVIQRQIKCVGLSLGQRQIKGVGPGQTNGIGLGNNTILFISIIILIN